MGWQMLGLLGLVQMVKDALSPGSREAWYDRVLHVIGGISIISAFLRGLVILILENLHLK